MFRKKVRSIAELLPEFLRNELGDALAAKAFDELLGHRGGCSHCRLLWREIYQEPNALCEGG